MKNFTVFSRKNTSCTYWEVEMDVKIRINFEGKGVIWMREVERESALKSWPLRRASNGGYSYPGVRRLQRWLHHLAPLNALGIVKICDTWDESFSEIQIFQHVVVREYSSRAASVSST